MDRMRFQVPTIMTVAIKIYYIPDVFFRGRELTSVALNHDGGHSEKCTMHPTMGHDCAFVCGAHT